MDIPNNVVHAFKVDTSISMPDIEEIKVETGVPLVQKKGSAVKGRRKSIYPFAKMRPPRPNGDMDSFFVRDAKDKTEQQNRQRIASAIFAYRKTHPQFKGKFKYRRVGDGIRVWRVE